MSSIVNNEILVKIGARGGGDGRNDEWDESGYGSVRQMFISHGVAINSIQMLYDFNGTMALAHKHGGDGDYYDTISLEPWEQIIVLSGRYGAIENKAGAGSSEVIIRSLTIVTNRTTYGPFGREEGTSFCFSLPCQSTAEFGGFHGRSNRGHLCAVGVYTKCVGVKHHFKPDLAAAAAARRRIVAPPRLIEELQSR